MDRVGDRTRCIQEMASGMRLEVLKSSQSTLVAEGARWQEYHRKREGQLRNEKEVMNARCSTRR